MAAVAEKISEVGEILEVVFSAVEVERYHSEVDEILEVVFSVVEVERYHSGVFFVLQERVLEGLCRRVELRHRQLLGAEAVEAEAEAGLHIPCNFPFLGRRFHNLMYFGPY